MKGFHFPEAEVTLTSGNPGSALVVRSRRTLHTLSSAIVGGGFDHTRTIVSRHVDRSYDVRDAASDLIHFARQHDIHGTFVGLMTAVFLGSARAATYVDDDLIVTTLATVGVGNRVAAGVSQPFLHGPGTINLIVLIDGQLTPAAMVNAVITATEAKTRVLSDQGIQAEDSQAATGTSTDAVVIACTGRGQLRRYAGPVTEVGWSIARSVRQAMMASWHG